MLEQQQTKLNTILSRAHGDYERGLNSYAFSKVHNHGTSDDLVQDTFTKTWRYLVRNGKINVMKAFLYHVLNGLVIDEYRKRKTVSLDTLVDKGFEPSIDESERHINFMDGKTAMKMIGSLPEKYKKVMVLRYVKMLSLNEISLISGETKNTVAVQLHRGLLKLKNLYNKDQK